MTLKQIGNYFLAVIISIIVAYVYCLVAKRPFTNQVIYNLMACIALLRTMEK